MNPKCIFGTAVIAFVAFCCCYSAQCHAEPASANVPVSQKAGTPLLVDADALSKNADYQADYAASEDLGKHRDLPGLKSLAQRTEKKYINASDKTAEYMLLENITFWCQISDFGINGRQYAFQLAQYILKANDAPADVAVDLLPLTTMKMEEDAKSADFTSEEWLKERAAYSRYWLTTLERIGSAIPASFDPKKPVMLYNVLAVYKDPADQAKFEKRMQEKQAESYKQSVLLQYYNLQQRFIPTVIKNVGWAFSLPPKRLENLHNQMTAYNIDPAVQEKILAEAKKKPDISTTR